MKAKLIFDLENPDDRVSFNIASKASDMASIIFEFTANCRKRLRQNAENDDVINGIDITFDKFYELLEEYDINVNKLI